MVSADSGEQEELPFDLETAIRVCRQAGYFEHASYLAKKYERHEDYLRIQIEDAGNFVDALVYLRKLGAETVCFICPPSMHPLTSSCFVGGEQSCTIRPRYAGKFASRNNTTTY